MAYVIAGPCIDVLDRSCMDECPVDCIYEGNRKLYINPNECVDCAACEPACPVEAIVEDQQAAGDALAFVADNALFFTDVLSGRDGPLGEPGGAIDLGRVGADTPLVAGHPAS